MQKTTSKLIAMALLVVAGFFSGCISEQCLGERDENDSSDTGERQAATVSIINFDDEEADTRGTSPSIDDNIQVELRTGRIFLVSGTRTILRYHDIVATEIESSGYSLVNNERLVNGGATARIYRGHLNTAPPGGVRGVTIPTVPAAARYVYIVGNYCITGNEILTNPLPAANPVGQPINNVLNRHLYINSQYNAINPGVTLFGRQRLINAGRSITFNNNPYNVFRTENPVHLVPRVARFEISSIVGTGDITGFTVEGIFMDGFYRQSTISCPLVSNPATTHTNGVINTATRHSGGTNYLSFTGTSHTNLPLGDTENAIHDWLNASSVARTVSPQTIGRPASYVFAYHLFATGYYNPRANVLPTPRPTATVAPPSVVIRLNNISVNNVPVSGVRFLTISEFRYAGSVGHNLYSGDRYANGNLRVIRPSRIYRLGTIEFAYRDLSTLPNDNSINVEVEISVDGWDTDTFRPEQPLRQSQLQDAIKCPCSFNALTLPPAVGGSWTFTYRWYSSLTGAPNSWGTPLLTSNQNLNFQNANFTFTESIWFRRVVNDGENPEIATQALFTLPEPTADFREYIEINGVKWATRNVDLSQDVTNAALGLVAGFAAHPSDPGMLFQWGRDYGWEANSSTDTSTGAPTRRWEGGLTGGWETITFPADWNHTTVPANWNGGQGPCPQGWRLPTADELTALRDDSPIGCNGGHGWWVAPQAPRASYVYGFGCRAGRIFNQNAANALDHLFAPAAGYRSVAGGTNGVLRNSQQSLVANTPAHYNNNPVFAGYFWASDIPTINNPSNNPAHLSFASNIGLTSIAVSSGRGAGEALSVRCVKDDDLGFRQPQPDSPLYICPFWCDVELGMPYIIENGVPVALPIADLTFQWQQSTNGTTWTDITGATSQNLTTNFAMFGGSITQNGVQFTHNTLHFRRMASWLGSAYQPSLPAVRNVPLLTRDSQQNPNVGVSLGGVQWATHNINFDQPNGFARYERSLGMFFQWGRPYGWRTDVHPSDAQGVTPGDGVYPVSPAPHSLWAAPAPRSGRFPRQRFNPITGGWEGYPTQNVTWGRDWVRGVPSPGGFSDFGGKLMWPSNDPVDRFPLPELWVWPVEHDPCRFVGTPGQWRLPTQAEYEALINAGHPQWIYALDAAKRGFGCRPGVIFGDAPGQALLFFPASGSRGAGTTLPDGQPPTSPSTPGSRSVYHNQVAGTYHSSTSFGYNQDLWARGFHFNRTVHPQTGVVSYPITYNASVNRTAGWPVRCVRVSGSGAPNGGNSGGLSSVPFR